MDGLKTFNEFNLALQELTKKGKVITSRINGKNSEYYKVKIVMDGEDEEFFEEGKDVMLTTIQLRNQII